MERTLKNGMPIKGTGIVVIDPIGRYLLIRRQDSKELGLVGGGFEGNELSVECAQRELREEVGIDIKDINDFHYIGACDSPPNPHKAKGDSVHGVSINYVVNLTEPEQCELNIQQTEIAGFRWVFGERLEQILSDGVESFYASSIETLNKFRELNGGKL